MDLSRSVSCNPHPPDGKRRTAVLIVPGGETPAEQAFGELRRRFGDFYSQIVFLSIGIVDYEVIDAQDYRSDEVPGRVRKTAEGAVARCAKLAEDAGMDTVRCVAIGTDPVEAAEKQAIELSRMCPDAMFFIAKLIFQNPRWWHVFVREGTPEAIQRRLEKRGIPLTVLPLLLPG